MLGNIRVIDTGQLLTMAWLTSKISRDSFPAMYENLISLRMHATRDGKHLSGAECLVMPSAPLEDLLQGLLRRALYHSRGRAEQINLNLEEVSKDAVIAGCLLDFSGFLVSDWEQGRMLACRLLTEAGVSLQAATMAMKTLANGAAPDGSSMRGAMLIDVCSGKRLEADQSRGVRASRMDLLPAIREQLVQRLTVLGLTSPRVVEALILASKVAAAPAILAELCWSDDPDYCAGYVASAAGYRRISMLKPAGDERGGRAFFVQPGGDSLAALVEYLEQTPYLIETLGELHPSRPWQD